LREYLVAELAKSVLGPALLRESMTMARGDSPLVKYLTGILAPKGSDYTVDISELVEQANRGEEDWNSPMPAISGDVKPPMDPGNMVNTMGISFTTESEDKTKFRACITWARYVGVRDGENTIWTRNPRHIILPIDDHSQPEFKIDGNGNVTTVDADTEIKISVIKRREQSGNNRLFFSLVVENCLIKTGENDDAREFVFQPQIRVVCNAGTKVVRSFDPKFAKAENDEGDTYEILYRERGIYARGRLVSATWKEVDPQICKDKSSLKIPDSADETPFEWIDGQLLTNPNDKKAFEEPDVRTEYLPLYSIASPEYDWADISKSDQGKQYTADTPELIAGKLAESWDPKTLRARLKPITDAYEKWIPEVDANLKQFRPKKNRIVDRILDDARETLERMREGIDELCKDEDPKIEKAVASNAKDMRLAFCFANRAIEMQYGWNDGGQTFEYRPFQMGFILSTIKSIADPKSKFRKTCDLLWVPTGAGKTEAYLMLTAFLVSYRRLRELGRGTGANPGAGIAVITRYTLRLLAIQQFRRTLSLFCACENLRVEEQSDSTLGWRPKDSPKKRDILWGTTAFNVGIWVGRALTPNKLKKANYARGQSVVLEDGALDIIVKNKVPEGSDPCQVANCPACETILSVSPGGLKAGRSHTIFLTVRADAATVGRIENALQGALGTSVTVNVTSSKNANTNYHTLALKITPTGLDFEGFELNDRIRTAIDGLGLTDASGTRLPTEHTVSARSGEIICNGILETKPSRPGYFMRTRHVEGDNARFVAYDFEIICPNPECPLGNKEWFAGTPLGSRHNSGGTPQRNYTVKGKRLESWTSGTTNNQNALIDVQAPFQLNNNISERIPIPALTVDEQIYGRTPTMIVSTVDKFARPAFESEAGAIFGNVDRYHEIDGYYRSDARNGRPPHGSVAAAHMVAVQPHYAPELIIQDELHLIEGPLGSMVGIYETVNDFLFSEGQDTDAKYIASTATVRRAEEQIKSVFARDLSLFPPHGHKINNRFFLKDEERHALDSEKSGRLYMGVCAPGKGGLTPHRKIWGSLLQSVYSQRNNPQIKPTEFDKFWTLTGYFNAVRELAGVQALYSQDIPDELKYLERNVVNRRHLSEDRLVEISSRQAATEIPSMLDTLNIKHPNAGSPDALLTTSMFGTGIDISRINAMVVAGQPKTTSSYIQATGRVGRNSGALVVTFLRASRPRDLSNYEIFTGNHRQIQRFVEAPTVYPFAEKNMNHCFGPMSVLILRNMRNKNRDWGLDDMPIMTRRDRNNPEVIAIPGIFETRARSQPKVQQPPPSNGPLPTRSAEHIAKSNLDQWRIFTTDQHGNALDLAQDHARPPVPGFKFNEYFKPASNTWNSVVLGDYKHQFARDRDPPQTPSVRIVYENAPESLREIEADFKLQVADLRPGVPPTSKQKPMGVRRSSFIYTYGQGSIAQTINGPRVIPTAQIGIFDANRRINPESHRIHNPRIDKILPSLLSTDVNASFQNCSGLAIYKIPTNDEVEFGDNDPVHLTRAFPDERLCTNYREHRNSLQIQDDIGLMFEGKAANNGECPVCRGHRDAPEARAVRFITACKGGHMDEIAWGWWIHRNFPNGRCPGGHATPLTGITPQYNHDRTFLWNSGGGATSATITITCPRCNTTVNFTDIKQGMTTCLGRNPEREAMGAQSGSSRHQGCNFEPRVVLMQAANLRSSEIITLLSLDENSTPLENIFFKPQVKLAVNMWADATGQQVSDANLDTLLDSLERQNVIPEGDMTIIRTEDRTEVVQAIQNRNPNFGDTYEELLGHEFSELIKGSISGVPAAGAGGRRNKFVMNYNNRKRFDGDGRWNRALRLATVDQLTTLSIQMSYQRDIRDSNPNTDPVNISTNSIIPTPNGNLMWFPGVEFQGEGLFIRFDDDEGWINAQIPTTHPSRTKWNRDGYGKRNDTVDGNPDGQPFYKNSVFRGKDTSPRNELDPHFVWWHTFAHALVRAISDDAGYSSAAIRERVYFERDDANGRVRGGILLYASQPGTEGTMGGLVALKDTFDQFVEKARDQITGCSADPLCSLNSFVTGGYIGSACHGCMMNSETSCELRNMYLDRRIFHEDPL